MNTQRDWTRRSHRPRGGGTVKFNDIYSERCQHEGLPVHSFYVEERLPHPLPLPLVPLATGLQGPVGALMLNITGV